MLFKETFVQIGARIRDHRLKSGMTLAQISEKSGLNPYYLRRVERGMKNITLLTLIKICTSLKIDPKDLLNGL